MRYLLFIFVIFFSLSSSANWIKISDEDYVWGPFKIYNLSLFSEDGSYISGQRPLMLSLKYEKPVEGRDFAISLARSWSNLGITLPEQDDVVDHLRKIMPNIRKDDVLSYIALEDKGYFVLNNAVIPEEFNQDFNNAVVAVWLDPRVEIGRKLLKNLPVVNTQSSENTDESGLNSSKTEDNQLQEIDKVEENSASSDKEQVSEIREQDSSEKFSDKEYLNPEIEVLPPFDPLPQNHKVLQ